MMDLIDALFARLNNDDFIKARADVWTRRNPDSPETLARPMIVIQLPSPVDTDGYHGAATDVACPIKIWGYGYAQQKPAGQLAGYLDVLLLEPLEFPEGDAGFTLRFSAEGWQDVETTDPKTIHMQNRYVTRHWSGARVTHLANPAA